MVQHYNVKSYETAAEYLKSSGITLPDWQTANEIVWYGYLHFQSPWLAYCAHLINQKVKHGLVF